MHQPTLVFSLLLLLPYLCFAEDGATHVQGRMMCNGEPYKNEKIEIYEKNWLGRDKLVVSTTTTDDGFFSMKGAVSEWFGFTPKMYVHFPNYCVLTTQIGNFQCANTIKVFVPAEFVSKGHFPKNIFNVGTIELTKMETEQSGLETIVYKIFDQQACRDV